MSGDEIVQKLSEGQRSVSQLREIITSLDWDSLDAKWGGGPTTERHRSIIQTLVRPAAEQFLALTATEEQRKALEDMGLAWILGHRWRDAFNSFNSGNIAGVPATDGSNVVTVFKSILPDLIAPLAWVTSLANTSDRQALAKHLSAAEQLTADAKAFLKELEVQRQEIEVRRRAVDEAAAIARQAALDAGLVASARALTNAMNQHRRRAWRWLCATVALAATMLVVVIWAMNCSHGPPRPDQSWVVAANIGYFATRAFGVSVLSFMLVAALRNYQSERHNQVVNQQRRDALSTFEKFKAASQGTVADAVTLQATQAIFTPQPTGFVGKDVAISTHWAELAGIAKGGKD